MSELERYQPEDIETTWRRAKGYALSGYFADAKSAEQAFVKISAGAEMGLTPFQSMTGIHIIDGKPVIGAGLLASMVDQDPDYDYTVAWEPNAQDATSCTVTILKNGNVRGESSFSITDAERAGLTRPTRNGKPSNFTVFPRNMLFARAMSNAVRWYAPGVTGTSTYVEGEIPTFEAPRQEHAEAKPRTRVTAEVIRDDESALSPEPGSATPPGPPIADVAPDRAQTGAPIEYEPVTLPALSVQLKALSLQDRADLYQLVGIAKGTPLGKVRDTLHAVAKSFAQLAGAEYDDSGDPNAAEILADARRLEIEALPDDAVEAFEHFAVTGQDLDADPQTALT